MSGAPPGSRNASASDSRCVSCSRRSSIDADTAATVASITAHVTALPPVMPAVGGSLPGIDMPQFALLLCLTPRIIGVLFIVVLIIVAVPWLALIR